MKTEELILSNPLTLDIALSVALLLLPFFSFLLLIINRKMATHVGAWIASTFSASGLLIALWLFSQIWTKEAQYFQVEWFKLWFPGKTTAFTAGVLLDDVAVLLLVVVTLVSFLVHLFSIAYMKGDPGYVRYFAFLGLFTFAMLGIVLADNLFLLFIFWELVGLSSYLLIGFWYKKKSAAQAGKKAFLINRIGDLGFLVAIMILWSRFETLDLESLKVLAANLPKEQLKWITYHSVEFIALKYVFSVNWLTIAGLGLFCGAIAKSAQFPLQLWLPDAMEGPTPVSALIHAATMVAAGVFLLARVFGLLNIETLTIIACVGVITAFMGAFAAFAQYDIKKVLAFSTISQLGYMVLGIGTGAYNAAIFHLITHAFFKACLFLCAGSVIHAMHRLEHDHKNELVKGFNAQDMRFMGGVGKQLPVTFIAYIFATASLIGLPFFSGYLSKDAILTGSYAWAEARAGGGISWFYLIPDLAFLTVLLTGAYMTRQFIMVFTGNFRGTVATAKHKLIESSMAIKVPLILLALLSLGFAFSLNPFSSSSAWVLNGLSTQEMLSMQYIDKTVYEMQSVMVEKSMELHAVISIVSVLMAVSGIAIGWSLYKMPKGILPVSPTLFNKRNILYRLSVNNFYLDYLYEKIMVRGVLKVSYRLQQGDTKVIDRFIDLIGKITVVTSHIIAYLDRMVIDGVIRLTVFTTGRMGLATKGLQGGKIQSYLMWSLIGLILIIALLIL